MFQVPVAVTEPLAQVHEPVDGVNCHNRPAEPWFLDQDLTPAARASGFTPEYATYPVAARRVSAGRSMIQLSCQASMVANAREEREESATILRDSGD
jgi:hypothetical protein